MVSKAIIAAAIALVLLPCPLYAAPVVLDNVPAYNWYHGCGPTAVGMVMGYWDLHGLPNLFTASGADVFLTANVQDQISSPNHNAKYDNPARNYVDDPAIPATYTSIADFYHTSDDALGLGSGWSRTDYTKPAIRDYAAYRGYTFTVMDNRGFVSFSFANLKTEIDAGRPVFFFVDSQGSGTADHFIPVFGYEDRGGGDYWYACYDTWSESESDVRWYKYQGVTAGSPFGVSSVTTATPPNFFKLTGTGSWSTGANWLSGSAPSSTTKGGIDGGTVTLGSGTANAQTFYMGVGGTGTMQQTGGTFNVGDLHVGYWENGTGVYSISGSSTKLNATNVYVGNAGTGTFTLSAGTVTVTGAVVIGNSNVSGGGTLNIGGGKLVTPDLIVGVNHPGTLNLTGSGATINITRTLQFGPSATLTSTIAGATVHFTGTSITLSGTSATAMAGLENVAFNLDGGGVVKLEAAGRDMGAGIGGFTNNFVVGSIVLGGTAGTTLQVRNDSANNPGWGGSEALYVNNLTLGAFCVIDRSVRVYYRNGGAPKEFLIGDADMNGVVDGGDYDLLVGYFNGTNLSWGSGDFDGNGRVDSGDYDLLVGYFGSTSTPPSGGSMPVPEPATIGLLSLGACCLLRKRQA